MVLVAVQLFLLGLYFPPVLTLMGIANSAPDDHFTASPDCRVTGSASRHVG